MKHNSISISSEAAEILQFLNTNGGLTIDEIAEAIKIPRAKIELITSQLNLKKLVQRKTSEITRFKLTNEAKEIIVHGLPENQILMLLRNFANGIPLSQVSSKLDLSKRAVNAGIGTLKKDGLIKITKGIVKSEKEVSRVNLEIEEILSRVSNNPEFSIPDNLITTLTQRGFLEVRKRQKTVVSITKLGKNALKNLQIVDKVSKITPDQIRTGKWKSLELKSYNVTAKPKILPTGSKHPYLSFLEEVKLKLIGLGFVEMRGPLVESEFWNFDALFQAQDHPAREWSDVYMIKNPSHGNLPKDKQIVDNVKKIHETGDPVGSRGWRYKWDPKKAARLILRPQGTVVSARTLYNMPIPSKYFSIARCYRPDSVDATHLSEFNQMEGISCDPSITFRDLLGLLKTFAIEVADATGVRFKPDYYPFTSPSVELSAQHPKLGYIEFGGAGIFRPEVTAPFGIKDPVIAWGLGIDRLYMVKRGINDIRELFSQNLGWLRTVPMT